MTGSMIDLQGFKEDLIREAGPGLGMDLPVIQVSCSYEFEPHGRASETWEEIWRVTIPEMCYYWLSTKGWKRGGPETKGMTFTGRSFPEAIQRASAWLTSMKNQGLRPRWFK